MESKDASGKNRKNLNKYSPPTLTKYGTVAATTGTKKHSGGWDKKAQNYTRKPK